MSYYIYILYLALPIFFANSLPVIANRCQWLTPLAFPIDNNKTFFGKRIFGDHKTFRGFVIGILGSILVCMIQFILNKINLVNVDLFNNFFTSLGYGALAGFGALAGDSMESFFKRQINIKSGRPFIPFDQIDYIIGFFIATSILTNWHIKDILFLLIFAVVANPLSNIIGYIFKIKKTYW